MLWVGEELAIQDVYIREIEKLGYEKVCLNTVAQAQRLLNKQTFDKHNRLFIVTQDMDYLKQDKQWQGIELQTTKSKNLLLIRYPSLDKRSKFYKIYSSTMTEFKTLSGNILLSHVESLFDTEFSGSDKLIEVCNSSYGRILLEADKIKTYADATGKSLDQAFNTLLDENVIQQTIEDKTFKFVDCLLYGNVEKSIQLANELNSQLDSPLGVLSLLYSGFRNMLSVQAIGNTSKDIPSLTGLSWWQINNAKKNIGGYSLSEIQKSMEIIASIEQGIKLGKISSDIALDYACIQIL